MEAQELLDQYISKLTPETQASSTGGWDDIPYDDYKIVKGVQEALVSGELSGEDLDMLILSESFTPRQVFLMGDIHDLGARSGSAAYDHPNWDKIVAQNKEQGILRRQELGM